MNFKRFLSVALVVVMLVSTVAFSANALESGKRFGFVVTADKTVAEIVPGAEVTVYIAYEMEDFSQLMSDMRLALLYDDTVYTPDLTSREFINDAAGYFKAAIVPTTNATFATTTMASSSWTAAEQALYNNCMMLQCGADAGLGVTSKMGYSVTEDGSTGVSLPEISVKFTVTGDAAAIAAGNINIALCDTCNKSSQYIKETNGTSTPTFLGGTDVDATKGNILANMPVGPAVNKYKAQLKMTVTSATTVADDFQFRVTSVITDADWDGYFANSADSSATTDAIQSMGIVAYKGSGTFDEATAKALVTDGTAATDYATASTTYVQKASDDADAYFGAIIKAKHSTMTNDVTYMGFVKYLDSTGAEQVVFYETAQTAAIASNYDTYVSQYIAANPYSA